MDNQIIIHSQQNSIIHNKEYIAEHYRYSIEHNASLTYFFMPTVYNKKVHISFSLAHDAELTFFVIIPEQLEALTLELNLNGSHSRAKVRGIYSLKNNQKCEITVHQNHKASHTTSDALCKGILNDAAIINFQSITHIDAHAAYSKAKTYNKNILLSPQAQAYSKPQLEIENNEVHCSHGSAMGQLDAMQLWYMQSHGLNNDQAKNLLIEGFFADTLDGVPCDMVSMVQNTINNMSKGL